MMEEACHETSGIISSSFNPSWEFSGCAFALLPVSRPSVILKLLKGTRFPFGLTPLSTLLKVFRSTRHLSQLFPLPANHFICLRKFSMIPYICIPLLFPGAINARNYRCKPKAIIIFALDFSSLPTGQCLTRMLCHYHWWRWNRGLNWHPVNGYVLSMIAVGVGAIRAQLSAAMRDFLVHDCLYTSQILKGCSFTWPKQCRAKVSGNTRQI